MPTVTVPESIVEHGSAVPNDATQRILKQSLNSSCKAEPTEAQVARLVHARGGMKLNPISFKAQRASCDENNARTCTQCVCRSGPFSVELLELKGQSPAAQQLKQRMQRRLGLHVPSMN